MPPSVIYATVEDLATDAKRPVELDVSAVAVEVDVRSPYAAIDAGASEAGIQSIIEAALIAGSSSDWVMPRKT